MSSSARTPHVLVLVEDRYEAQPQPAGLVAALRRRAVPTRVVVAEQAATRISGPREWASADVVLARGRSRAVLGLLRSAEQAGVPVVDTAAAILGVVDKAGMTAALAAGDVRTPRSWLGNPGSLVRRPDLRFPLVLKPVTGDNARGLRVVSDASGLAELPWPESVAVAQEWHRGRGIDLKLYCIGDGVWAVRRPSPVADDGRRRTVPAAGRPVPVDAEMAKIAARCRSIFGLSLAGIDCVDSPDGLLAIEVNDFPTYRGVEHADERLADLVLARARGARRRGGTGHVRRPVVPA